MDVDVWPVQLPLMPRKYLATTFHIQGVSEVCIPVQIPLGPRRRKSGEERWSSADSVRNRSTLPGPRLLCSKILPL